MGDGQYLWQHDQVLLAIEDAVMKAIWTCKFRAGCKEKLIYFIKPGEKGGGEAGKNIPNILLTTPD